MDFNLLTLDFQNNSFYVKKGDFEYLWTDPKLFITDTGFPFNDIVSLSYEPQRALYLIELTFGRLISDRSSDEMQWVEEHFDNIAQIAKNKKSIETTITLDMMRSQLLYDSDWVVQRHTEQKFLQIATSLTDEIYSSLLEYRQKLRDLTLTYEPTTPASSVNWPNNPLD